MAKRLFLTLLVLTACSSAMTPVPPVPMPESSRSPLPSTGKAIEQPLSRGPWIFPHTPGTYTYHATVSGSITLDADTAKQQTFSISQVIALVIGTNGDVQFITNSDTKPNIVPDIATTCTPQTPPSLAWLRHVIPVLPDTLTQGATWQDSVAVVTCQGSLPITANVVRNYVVLGEVRREQQTALHVMRTSTNTTTGNGVDGQHHISLAGIGIDTTSFYLDPTHGRLLESTGHQIMHVTITTSGRTTAFTQRSTQYAREQ